MNPRSISFFIIGFLLLSSTVALWADSKYGKRPIDSIFDPSGILTSEQRKQISKPFREILENEQIDLLIIIHPEIGDAPPEFIAKNFAEIWIESKIHAVVFHVPGNPESPWIVPSESSDSFAGSKRLKELLSEGEKRAAAEPDDFRKVRAASVEAADLMRFIIGEAVLNIENTNERKSERQLEFQSRARLLRLSAILGAVAFFVLAVGGIFLFFSSCKRRKKVFPEIRKVPRFGAPYTGGNYSVSKSYQSNSST